MLMVMLAAAVLQGMLHGASAQTCSRMYRKAGKPLLFGGVGEPNRCLKNCQSRTDYCKSVCSGGCPAAGWEGEGVMLVQEDLFKCVSGPMADILVQ